MQTKSSRGVQQSEVWAAADTLLAEGVRPTIERVRQKLGRGSPNTVAPMLESWFATLGPRLGLGTEDEEGQAHGLPMAVQQAFQSIWSTALTAAEAQAQEGLAAQHQALETERQALEKAQVALDQQLETAKLHEMSLQQALSATQRHLEEMVSKASQLESALKQSAQELATVKSSLADLAQERNEERRRHEARMEALAADHRHQLEQATSTEHRHLQEIDRLRQDIKKALQDAAAMESHHEEKHKQLEQASRTLGTQYRNAELEIAGLRERAAVSQARAEELQRLVEKGLAGGLPGKEKRAVARKTATSRRAGKTAS